LAGQRLNSIIQQIWSKYMPLPNDPQSASGDRFNTQGYLSTISLPQSSDFDVIRLDHDFGDKWHFMSSYRYYTLKNVPNNQVDIGGALPGDTFGPAVSTSSRPQKPSSWWRGSLRTSPHT
jgi:hypothetical protein